MACGHAGSRMAVIAVAPAAEPVPTDRHQVTGTNRLGDGRARAARAVDQTLRERAARGAQCARMGRLTVMAR